ncbi:hypothetical protein P4377_24390 [Bacillus thuringiensis]|nr:hypothetical protein [Bacillus thuringiensis]
MHPKKNKTPKPVCYAFPVYTPPAEPVRPIYDVVHNSLCGNISLNQVIPSVEIWKTTLLGKVTITLAVFNRDTNTSSIHISIHRLHGQSVTSIVPPGNTISTTVDYATSIMLAHNHGDLTEGTYHLEISFVTSF